MIVLARRVTKKVNMLVNGRTVDGTVREPIHILMALNMRGILKIIKKMVRAAIPMPTEVNTLGLSRLT